MTTRKCKLILWLVFFKWTVIFSQAQFEDKTSAINIQHTYGSGMSGGGVSFCDFDGDGKDDLTLASSENRVIYFYKNNGSNLTLLNLLPDFKEEVKSVLWSDLDNDGDKDLFACVLNGQNRLFENKGDLQLQDVTAQSGLDLNEYTSYGACIGDYNRDGLLDIYVSERRVQTDGLPNRSLLFKNNGNMTFTNVTTASGAEDEGKTPFCSAFVDVNNDKWPDLYTAHDRLRGNTLLVNKGDGTFKSVGPEYNADLKMDGMSASVADVNHDGYFDIYVSNSDAGNALFINKGGSSFMNEAGERGVAFNGVAWGTNFLDGDNDGDDDLYVSSMLVGKNNITSTYYTNEYPQLVFSKGEQVPSDTVSSFNNAVGDINNDGYPDLAVSNSTFPSLYFQNKGGNNNYLAIRLQGVMSNRDGTGSLITVYANGKAQFKYTQCGLGFLGQNSNRMIFGLGSSAAADSIEILWPTGHIDKFRFIAGNSTYDLVEGMSTGGKINIDGELILYNTQVADLDGFLMYPNPSSGYTYIFNNSETQAEIKVYDTNGKLMGRHFTDKGHVQLDYLSNGVYIIEISTAKGNKIFRKLTIQK